MAANVAPSQRTAGWWLIGVVTTLIAIVAAVLVYLWVRGEQADRPLLAALGAVAVVLLAVAAVAAVLVRRSPCRPARRRPDGDETDVADESPRWSAVKALVAAAIVSSLVLAMTVGLLLLLRGEDGESSPEEALSLVFVAAAVVLILVVCTLTIVMKRLKLVDSREAMGLPRGSIRAVIALMLILLFFIAAVFLFNTTRRIPPAQDELRTLQGIGEARFATIPTELLFDSDRQVAEDGTVTYDVVLTPSPLENQASDDLAKQLITVLGTLVTAIAAFYFGSNSVSSALKGQAEAGVQADNDGTSPPGGRQGGPQQGSGTGGQQQGGGPGGQQ